MSTQTPKPKATATAIPVFPNPVPVFLIPLPQDYPRLPITEMAFQPVAYNQGTGKVTYVTVLVPLPARQTLIPAAEIIMDEAPTGTTFTYSIQNVADDTAADFDRLALMSFSFLSPTPGMSFKVAIEVFSSTGSATESEAHGKVVMDSDMDPTFALTTP